MTSPSRLNCETCRDRLLDYLGGHLRPAEAAAVEEHLAECSECAAMVTEMGALPFLLLSDETALEQLNRKVLASLPGKAAAPPTAVAKGWLERCVESFRRSWLAWGAAGGALVAAGLALLIVMTTIGQPGPTPLDLAETRLFGTDSPSRLIRDPDSLGGITAPQEPTRFFATLGSEDGASERLAALRSLVAVVDPNTGDVFTGVVLDAQKGLVACPARLVSHPLVRVPVLSVTDGQLEAVALDARLVIFARVIGKNDDLGISVIHVPGLSDAVLEHSPGSAEPAASARADSGSVRAFCFENDPEQPPFQEERVSDLDALVGQNSTDFLQDLERTAVFEQGRFAGFVTRKGQGEPIFVPAHRVMGMAESLADSVRQARQEFAGQWKDLADQALSAIAENSAGEVTWQGEAVGRALSDGRGGVIVEIDPQHDAAPAFAMHTQHPGIILVMSNRAVDPVQAWGRLRAGEPAGGPVRDGRKNP